VAEVRVDFVGAGRHRSTPTPLEEGAAESAATSEPRHQGEMGCSSQPLVGQQKVVKPMAKEESSFWMPRQPASGGEPVEPASGGEPQGPASTTEEENVSVPAWMKTIFERRQIGANDAQWKRLKSRALYVEGFIAPEAG